MPDPTKNKQTKKSEKNWPSNEQIIISRAGAILKNADPQVALQLFISVNLTEIDRNKFWVVLPYLVNLSCCYQKLGFTARAYELLQEGSDLIDSKFLPSVEPGEKRYQMGRLIICASYIWKNMEILLKEAGLNPLDQIENWNVKTLLLEKQKHLFE